MREYRTVMFRNRDDVCLLLMAFYLTTVNGISQIQAGLILSSSSIATMLITPLAAKANKWGHYGLVSLVMYYLV